MVLIQPNGLFLVQRKFSYLSHFQAQNCGSMNLLSKALLIKRVSFFFNVKFPVGVGHCFVHSPSVIELVDWDLMMFAHSALIY